MEYIRIFLLGIIFWTIFLILFLLVMIIELIMIIYRLLFRDFVFFFNKGKRE